MASTNPLPAFSFRHALAWTAIVALLLFAVMAPLRRLLPGPATLVVGGLLQTAIFGAAALALVGAKGRAAERLRMLGFAPAPAWLLAAGAALGVALHGPTTFVAALVHRVHPWPEAALLENARLLSPSGVAARAALFAVVALVVPLVEEVLFRGAMFARLRLPGSRQGALVATAVCFVVVHVEPRLFAPLAIVALALTVLRALGRGIWPCFLLHASFNATTLAVAFSRAPEAPIQVEPPLAFVIGGAVVSLAILALLLKKIDLERREFA